MKIFDISIKIKVDSIKCKLRKKARAYRIVGSKKFSVRVHSKF